MLKWVVCERKFVIFFPRCVSVISSTRLWKRHLCQALNIALNTPIQGIDPDGICVLPSRRSERANFTKIPRSELSTFSKLIPISRKKKKFLTSSPPSSLLFLAEYFNKTLRELMEKRGNKKKNDTHSFRKRV